MMTVGQRGVGVLTFAPECDHSWQKQGFVGGRVVRATVRSPGGTLSVTANVLCGEGRARREETRLSSP